MFQSNGTVLCVDDSEANLTKLEYMISARQYEVFTAGNGQQAWDVLTSKRVDIVVLDTKMPVMDGYRLSEAIKQTPSTKHIPILMMIDPPGQYERMKGLEIGIDDFITRPIDQAELIPKISSLLNVKLLKEKLNSAYDNITRMADVGAAVLKKFNPWEFDLVSKIDDIVGQIIRRKKEEIERPEMVVVKIVDEHNKNQWYHYRSVFEKVDRRPLPVNIVMGLPPGQDSELLFFNEDSTDQMFLFFIAKIASQNIIVKNMVCYKSESVSMFALNYGRPVSSYDAAVLNSIVMQTLFLKSLSNQIRETEEAFEYTVRSLARASEASDEDTGHHIIRVGLYCVVLAKKMGLTDFFTRTIKIQSALHDVGKIQIPPSVLRKAGKLTPEEWDEMKRHTVYGGKIIGEHPRFHMAKALALYHHERWDGTGYPHGISGEQIPIEARIMTIADQYDALRNARAYKPAFDHQKTIKILLEGDGRSLPCHFDPRVLKAFEETAARFEEIYESMKS